MIQPPYDAIRRTYRNKGYAFFLGPFNLNLFGIRSRNRNQALDGFDDTIGVAYHNESSHKKTRFFEGTVDPGLTHLTRPKFAAAIKDGTAILKPGQYRGAYQIGRHGTGAWQHTALIQVKPVTIYRDSNRDAILDTNGKETTGLYGINIHAASLWQDLDKIGAYSAGCQVLRKANDLETIIALCRQQMRALRSGSFTYTLFDEADFF